MRILVTGGSGMVGNHLKDIISMDDSNTYIFVSSKELDLRNQSHVDHYIKHGNFDGIIHLAARVGGLYANMISNSGMLVDNLRINLNVLEACFKYQVNRGIFCLSSCIYPKDPSKFPMTEDMINESPPHESNEGYAYSKRIMKVLCDQYNENYGRSYICLSPVNLYGPYDNYCLKNSHVIPGLIHKMFILNRKNNMDSFNVMGSGQAMRQFLYARDFADIILKFLYNRKIKGGLYNICSDEEFTIHNVVTKLSSIWDINPNRLYFNTMYSDGIIKKTVSNEKFKTIYPDFQFTSFDEGIKKSSSWFKDNYKIARTGNK